MGALSILTQTSFRGRNDDGNETAATWKAAINTNWNQLVTTNFRVRFLITHEGGLATPAFQLEYNKNGGGWNSVTTSSANIIALGSANLTNGEATTQQMGAGTFVAGECSEDGLTAGIALTLAVETEVEYVVQVVDADTSDGDDIELRVTNGGVALDAYINSPTITVGAPHRIFVIS